MSNQTPKILYTLPDEAPATRYVLSSANSTGNLPVCRCSGRDQRYFSFRRIVAEFFHRYLKPEQQVEEFPVRTWKIATHTQRPIFIKLQYLSICTTV